MDDAVSRRTAVPNADGDNGQADALEQRPASTALRAAP
jgi:hypothetical protein